MADTLSIGATPHEEDCALRDARQLARVECKLFRDQIRRAYGPEPDGAQLYITSNPHDFGTYYEVNVRYTNEAGEEYAYKVEADPDNKLSHWDEIARAALYGP